MIVAENLGKSYGRFEAVKQVSFTVRSGEILGLLGPNGAGKTTIMKILTGYHLPSVGRAELDGIDVTKDPLAVKRIVGYLPENAPLYPDLNVEEYLRFAAGARGLYGAERKNAIERMLETCGLVPVVRRPIDRLSKGFRQRVGLAQALIHEPSILILDEPTNGLDPNQILEIRQLIRTLGEKKTVILSTHILQEVEAVCTGVIILHEGTVVAHDTAENLGRNQKGETVFTLLLKAPSGKRLQTALGTVPLLRSVTRHTQRPDGTAEVRLSLEPERDAAERVFDWAVANGLKILSMHQEHLSLEEVFVKLTRESIPSGGRS